MAEKILGAGSIFSIDYTDLASFEAVGCLTSLGSPSRRKEPVDVQCLEDTLVVPVLAVETTDEFSITQVWEAGDTEHEKLDTMFAAGAEHDARISRPYSTAVTDTFSVLCTGITPNEITPTGAITRTATFKRTGAITRA